MRLEYRLNGRRVPARDIGRELAREMERRTRAALDWRARSARCPIHMRYVTTYWSGSELKVNACCAAALAAVTRAVNAIPPANDRNAPKDKEH